MGFIRRVDGSDHMIGWLRHEGDESAQVRCADNLHQPGRRITAELRETGAKICSGKTVETKFRDRRVVVPVVTASISNDLRKKVSIVEILCVWLQNYFGLALLCRRR